MRGADNILSSEWARDQANRLVFGLHYSSSSDPQIVTGHYVNESGFPLALTDSGAASVQYTRTAKGFDEEVRYFDRNGKPVADDQGSYGESREFDARGLVTRGVNRGFGGQPAWRNDGARTMSAGHSAQMGSSRAISRR